MSKFTDAVRTTLQNYFDAGDQPLESQFDALILAIQEGIEEHQHDGTGDGDGLADLTPTTVAISGAAATPLTLTRAAAANLSITLTNNNDTLYVGIGVNDAFYVSNAADLGTDAILAVTQAGRMGLGGLIAPTGMAHFDQPSGVGGIPVLVLDQADQSEGFVDFLGTSAASAVGPISSWTTAALNGFVRVEINGVAKWMPYYNAPTS